MSKYPNVTVPLVGGAGDAMSILGRVQRALSKAGVPKEEVDAFMDDATGRDYDHLLATCIRWVKVEEQDGLNKQMTEGRRFEECAYEKYADAIAALAVAASAYKGGAALQQKVLDHYALLFMELFAKRPDYPEEWEFRAWEQTEEMLILAWGDTFPELRDAILAVKSAHIAELTEAEHQRRVEVE